MLSRVADALYWMSRYLERAEQVARLLDVCFHLELDLYSLDYADTPGLTDFAERRARQFGLQSVVSDRALSRL